MTDFRFSLPLFILAAGGIAAMLDTSGKRAGPRPFPPTAAFLACLRARSRRAPALLVADDVQWLDGPTAVVLAYAARRLRDEPVGFVFAHRTGTPKPSSLDLDRFGGHEACLILRRRAGFTPARRRGGIGGHVARPPSESVP